MSLKNLKKIGEVKLNKAEYEQLCDYITSLDEAIKKFEHSNKPSGIYDVSCQIDALYGKEIDGISEQIETMSQFQGLAKRSAQNILAILKKYKISDNARSCLDEKIDDSFLVHTSEILGNTNIGLSGKEIVKYCNKYAVEFKVSIPISDSNFIKLKVPNKRTALLLNLRAFNSKQQFKIIKELSELSHFKNNEEVKKIKTQLYARYNNLAEEQLYNTELIVETKHWLQTYPKSLSQYTDALNKYKHGIFERNTLDDIRLAFELLVKDLLGNEKSLENQIPELCKMLKTAGTSVELRNMVQQVIKYYADFQNNHVKHNDTVNKDEIEYVIELTSVIMKFLIKVIGGNQNV